MLVTARFYRPPSKEIPKSSVLRISMLMFTVLNNVRAREMRIPRARLYQYLLGLTHKICTFYTKNVSFFAYVHYEHKLRTITLVIKLTYWVCVSRHLMLT